MGLIAEQVVEEWLHHRGFFTIRGAKSGNNEADILAIKVSVNPIEALHVEVQASHSPVGYISFHNAKPLDFNVLKNNVNQWIEKKFNSPKIKKLKEELYAAQWERLLVVNVLKFPEERQAFIDAKLNVKNMQDIVGDLREMRKTRKASKLPNFGSANSEFTNLIDSLSIPIEKVL